MGAWEETAMRTTLLSSGGWALPDNPRRWRGARSVLGFALLLSLAAGCEAESADKADASSADSADAQLEPFDPDADPQAGLESGVEARFEPAGTDWHAMPFPIDTRYKPDGRLDLSGFPTPREGSASPLLQNYIEEGERVLTGFSIQPTIYVQMQGQLSAAPSTLETVAANGKVVLVDVSPESPEYGRHIPLEVEVSPKERGQYLAANLIMAHPVWGRPLRPLTTYAFVVRRGWLDASGKPLGQSAVWKRVLGRLRGTVTGDDSAEGKVVQALAPLKAAVDAAVVRVPWADMAMSPRSSRPMAFRVTSASGGSRKRWIS